VSKRGKKYTPRAGSNAEFVAAHIDLPPPEILRLAKKQKRRTTLKAIYTARSQLRKRGVTNGAIARPDEVEVIGVVPRTARASSNGAATSTAAAEAQLRRLILQLGSIAVHRELTKYEQQIDERN
jgi:hypothetical protein